MITSGECCATNSSMSISPLLTLVTCAEATANPSCSSATLSTSIVSWLELSTATDGTVFGMLPRSPRNSNRARGEYKQSSLDPPPPAPRFRPQGGKMRVLLACPRCKRQHDASALAPGASFRCRCGETLAVPQVRAADAVVVRCSSCGAPREEGAAACSYCGADFTARERDENTLCPVCFARVSNRSRYCSACGAVVAPEEAAGSEAATDRPCPVCGAGRRLVSRTLGATGLSALECGGAGGRWRGEEAFQVLSERARA